MVASILKFNNWALKSLFKTDISYWSSLAKILHLWRDNTDDVLNTWITVAGPEDAIRCAKRVPPMPLSGRWGSASACEAHILQCDRGQLALVLGRVLGRKHAKQTRANQGPDQLNELSLEAMAEHSAKMSRWAKDALKALKSDAFWAMLRVSSKVKGPLDHFYYSLLQRKGAGEPTNLCHM
eukprot:2251623-Alexandrium_andersonii.AAC.1